MSIIGGLNKKQHIFISQDDITSVCSLSTATRINWIIKIFDDAGNLHNAEDVLDFMGEMREFDWIARRQKKDFIFLPK